MVWLRFFEHFSCTGFRNWSGSGRIIEVKRCAYSCADRATPRGPDAVDLLIVEDDLNVAAALADALKRHGFGAATASTAADALELCEHADLILLDLGLPDLDGLVLCRRLRERTGVPIIVVTARDDEIDVVLGLQAGADDYIVKPYGRRELLARIDAVSRRMSPATPNGGHEPVMTATTRTALRIGDVTIDLRSRRVCVGEAPIALTRKEYAVLALLARDPGSVVERGELISTVWGEQWDGASRTLDVHISMLRHKLGDADLVENVRGVGYRLRES
jgi:two-component system, OmpR family, response regulator RegX3